MIYAWGANNFGQLGVGSFTNATVPTEITELQKVGVKQIDASKYNSVILSTDGSLYMFGKAVP